MSSARVFLLSLLASLVLQGIYWNHFDVLDGQSWVRETEALRTVSITMLDPFVYGYPGTPPMVLAIVMHTFFGVSIEEAFFGSLALIISLATATAALLCKLLRPRLPWWIGTVVALSTTILYRNATPPSAVALPFIVILALLALYVYEKRPLQTKWPFLLLGITIGASAAARLDITLFVVAVEFLFIAPLLEWSAVAFTALVALLFFFLLNPFLWFFPVHYLRTFIWKVLYHYQGKTNVIPPLALLLKISPFSWLGLLYGIVLTVWRKTDTIIPRMFILNMVFLTALLTTVLYAGMYRPLWYFAPLLLLWEVLFLLFVLEFTARVPSVLGFSQRSLFNLYLAIRLVIFLVLVLGRAPALSFFA